EGGGELAVGGGREEAGWEKGKEAGRQRLFAARPAGVPAIRAPCAGVDPNSERSQAAHGGSAFVQAVWSVVQIETIASGGSRAASELFGIVEQDRSYSQSGELNGCRQPAQAATDDDCRPSTVHISLLCTRPPPS